MKKINKRYSNEVANANCFFRKKKHGTVLGKEQVMAQVEAGMPQNMTPLAPVPFTKK